MNKTYLRIGSMAILLTMLFSLLPAWGTESLPLGELDGPRTTLSVRGELSFPGALSWYSFAIPDGADTVVIRVEPFAESGEIRVLLFDEAREYIDSALENELRVTLHAGTYYLRIDSLAQARAGYTLIIYNGVESESNDGLVEADDLGEISSVVMLSAALWPAGDADYYRFSVPSVGLPDSANALLIEALGSGDGDTVMVLYQLDDEEDRFLPIAFDDDSGDGFWSRLLVLPESGTQYAVRVEEFGYPYEGIEEYTLAVRPVKLTLDPEPNDTAAEAIPMDPAPMEDAGWQAEGVLESPDDVDFYSFTLTDDALVDIATTAQAGLGIYGTFLTLLDEENAPIASSASGGDASSLRIRVPLPAGDYTVSVEAGQYSASLSPYRLLVFPRPVELIAEAEPNDDEDSAQDLLWQPGTAIVVAARIDPEGDVDAYRIVLDETVTITIETGPAVGSQANEDTVLSLYDRDLWQIAYNDDFGGTRWSRIQETLAPGTYYVVVGAYYDADSFPYSLLVTEQDQ